MKKPGKLLTVLLSLVMAFPLLLQGIQPEQAKAASTAKQAITIYAGQSYSLYELTGYRARDCSSVKSSATKVAAYKKSGEGTITAKKAGKTILTVKPKKGSKLTYSIKVVKPWIKVTMLDVGQGDSFLIQTANRNILLDTGEYRMYSSLKAQLAECGAEKIDALIISHFDTDHFGSAQSVMKDFGKDAVCIHPSRGSTSSTYKNFMNAMNTYCYDELVLSRPDEGNRIKAIEWEGMKFTLLAADEGEDTNDSSLVIRLDFDKSSWLFTGDASAKVLNGALDKYPELVKADVLKVAHHGSDYSNPVLFLSKAGADYALIGVGEDNDYGHPTQNVLARLQKYTGKILRTDIDGTVSVTYAGGKYTVETSKATDAEPETVPVPSSGKVIGNINSKVYHSESCESLPAEKNRKYFDSAEEAEAAGYHACSRCGGK